MKIVIWLVVLVAWAYVCHLAGKFCGFNQLGHDDGTDPKGTQPEVASKSKGQVR
jgi:hypothetical protein